MKTLALKPQRRFSIVLALLVFLLLFFISSSSPHVAQAVSTNLVISQVYGGGGNTGAPYRNDFVELFNRGTTTVSLTGLSIQYASATGTGNFSSNPIAVLSGSLAPGQYYLIQQSGGTVGAPLPTPNATGTVNMSATGGKVALVNSTTGLACNGGSTPCSSAQLALIVDLVGYDGANFFEGAPTATLSNTTAAIRRDGGCTETDNNSTDFFVSAPTPRNTSSTLNPCEAPRVSSTAPASGAINVARETNITINFNEPVNVAGNWFTISCAVSDGHPATFSGGPTSFILDPNVNFAQNETCTVTVLASGVTDQDTNDPPDNMAANYVFSFTTTDVQVCGDPATAIHTIQGSGTTSPMNGTPNVVIEGIVVGDYQNTTTEFSGFYVQEEDPDADSDPQTSEGIFVFDNNFGVNVNPGDKVRVKGNVTEFSNLTELNSVSTVLVCSSGNSVTPTTVTMPVANLTDWERYEGMSITIPQNLTVTENFTLGRFGEVSLSVGGRLFNPTNVTTPGASAIARQDLNNRSRILLDDGNNQQNSDPTRYPTGGLSASNTLRDGYTVNGVGGVLDQRFGDYRVQPVGAISFAVGNARTAAPVSVGGNLKVASFNVLNYFNGDGLGGGFPTPRGATTSAEFTRQRVKIINAIKTINADIVGLMEIENDAPPNSATEDLVSGLNAAMGAGTYAFINTGVVGTDQIRVAIIYKPASVTPAGSFAILNSSVNPLFIDTKNRPTLAETFVRNSTGAKLTVVVNHLKSKGSDCNDVGDPDTGDGQGNCNITRRNAASALMSWLATDPTNSGDLDFLIIGDMNSYALEDPITVIRNVGYINLVDTRIGASAYSYVFDGQSGYLDHALASPNLNSQVTGVSEWHINADEPIVLDYNVEFKTANQINTFYDSGPYRSSDHDPVIVGLNLNAPPTVSAGGPYNVNEGSSVVVAAAGNDPDGGTLTYAWDLDNNGTFETAGQSATYNAAVLDGPITKTIRVQVTDDGGLTAIATASVNVQNVAPSIGAVTAPVSPQPVNTQITASASFTDPGVLDTHTALCEWGDSAFSVGTVSEISGSGSVSCNHTYSQAGVYTVRISVTDDDGGSGQSVFQYIVVYDPAAGFVTGGGWINSPAGAYTPNLSLTGKPTFGFVSKYQNGANVPSGQTQFYFHGASFDFHSTSYDWLVIAGARAQYKGSGTINGSGDYAFMLTAIDGQVNGGGGGDRFRLKVWNKSTSAVIYDNQMNNPDDADPTTSLGGGSIVIHK